MTLRAKFRLATVSTSQLPIGVNDADGSWLREEMRTVLSITAYPVGRGSEENQQFFASTPAGRLDLSLVNPAALEGLRLGDEFYVDLVPAGS